MAKKKFYAVAAGRSTGIFSDWATTEKQVKGFGGAKYKSFTTREEADAWLKDPVYKQGAGRRRTASGSGGNTGCPHLPEDPDTIVVFTDGGSINNPGPGGYGLVIEEAGKRREMSGGFRYTTNNRMEMMAALVALKELQHCGKKIVLYSDSSYLVNGITKGWVRKWRLGGWRKSDGKPVLNSDLWKELLRLQESMEVSFRWVKGHAGNELNERCDQLAVAAARRPGQEPDLVYENLVNREEHPGESTV